MFPSIPSKRNHSEIDLFDKIKNGDVKGVQRCLSDQRTRKKINIDCFDDDGFTPLFATITEDSHTGMKRMIRILLEYGAQINSRSRYGQTVLSHACDYRYRGNADAVKVLLKNGADPNLSSLQGFAPLHIASRMRHVAAVKSLLQSNADVNYQNDAGDTPLIQACRDSRRCQADVDVDEEETVSILIENNASVNVKNNNGKTALHMACSRNKHSTVETLLRHGADPKIICNNGWTPLHIACQATGDASIKILLDYNADINFQDNEGNTPLHHLVDFYVTNSHVKCLQTLLERNADFNIKNSNGETPLLSKVQICLNPHNVAEYAFVELLLMFGSSVNVQRLKRHKGEYNREINRAGVIRDTPLHVAVRNNNKKLVQMILNRNPDLQIVNRKKQTALDLTKELHTCTVEIKKCMEEHIHKIRCQMYTFYRETWCQLESPDNMKSISPVKKRKRKQYSKQERKIKVKSAK